MGRPESHQPTAQFSQATSYTRHPDCRRVPVSGPVTPARECVLVLLAGSTGLRRGKLIGLRWGDIDLEWRRAKVTRSVWRNVEGETKTEASRKPVPLHSMVIEELKRWKLTTLYRSDGDFVFPSIAKNGTQPISPDMILKRHIRPALKRIRVTKRIGFHSFRHGLATMLRQLGVDIKTAQELLRHANSRITLEIYQQSVCAEKREAQDRVMETLFAPNGKGAEGSNPSAPLDYPRSNYLSRKPLFLLDLWRGRRGSNPRPLP